MKYYKNYLRKNIIEHKKIISCCFIFFIFAFISRLRLGHNKLFEQDYSNILLYEDDRFFFLFLYPLSMALLYGLRDNANTIEWVRLSNKEKFYLASVIQLFVCAGILSFMYLLLYRLSVFFYPSDRVHLGAYLESFLGVFIQLTAYLMLFQAVLQFKFSRIYTLIAFLIGCFMNCFFFGIHPEYHFTLPIYQTFIGKGVFSNRSLLFIGIFILSFLFGEWLFKRRELL